MSYEATYQAKARLLARMKKMSAAIDTDRLCTLAAAIEGMDRRERAERREVEFDKERKRLWAIVAREYNALSGFETSEWIGEEDGRERALTALEGHPSRVTFSRMDSVTQP